MRALIITLACLALAGVLVAILLSEFIGPAEQAPDPEPEPAGPEDDAGAEDEQWADELGQMNAERDADAERAERAAAERAERIALEADLIAMEWYGYGDSEAMLQVIRDSERAWDDFLASGALARADWLEVAA